MNNVNNFTKRELNILMVILMQEKALIKNNQSVLRVSEQEFNTLQEKVIENMIYAKD